MRAHSVCRCLRDGAVGSSKYWDLRVDTVASLTMEYVWRRTRNTFINALLLGLATHTIGVVQLVIIPLPPTP